MMLIERIQHGDILSPADSVDVFVRPSPLRQERHQLRLPAGLSLAEIIEASHAVFPFSNRRRLYVSIGGHAVPADLWARVRVKPGATVNIVAVPGKDAFRAILGLVVAIGALFFAPLIAGAIGLAGSSLAVSLIGAGISLAGSMVINALFPVGPQENKVEKTKTLYSIGGGQNSAAQYGAIPVVFARHRISPPYASGAYTELRGNNQYLRQLFCLGYGPMDVSDIRIGETPISRFDDVDIEVIENHLTESPTLYTKPVFEEAVQILLDKKSGWVTRTTAADVSYISVDVSYPSGVIKTKKKDGKDEKYEVVIEAEYRLKGSSGAWSPLGTDRVFAKTRQAMRRTIGKDVPSGQYDIRLRKATSDYTGSSHYVTETCYWTALRGRRNAAVVKFDQPLTLIALRIRATGELSGTVDRLNCIVEPLIRAWDGSNWVDGQKSRNPADHFRHVLQGSANARPVSDSLIDLQSLQDWHAYCAANGFTFEYVATEQRSVYEMLTTIAAAGRGAVSLRDGRWGVVWDVEDSPIVQHFTPRNSWGFKSDRSYADLPHGFRVAFVNRDNGYLNDERVVYDDGFTAANATKFEGIDFPGITDKDLVWKHGRYHIAQLRLQRETYTLSTDFEHLVCTRGDRVRVNHDVVLWGAGAGRVKAVSSAPDTVTIDDTFAMEAGKTYSMRFRLADGSTLVRKITGADGEFDTFTWEGSGGLPAIGDLVMFGEDGLESVVLRVKSIMPQADLTAQLELVDDAPAIMAADKGAIPPFQTGIPAPIDYRAHAPTSLSIGDERVWTTTPPTSAFTLSWLPPDVGRVASYLVETAEKGSEDWLPVQAVTQSRIDLTGLEVGSYDVRIRAVFDNGEMSGWLRGTFKAAIFAAVPSDVSGFAIAVAGDLATLQWDAPDDAEAISHLQLRYSPVPSAFVTWQTASILRPAVTGTQVQVPAMQGTYLIKAVTWAGLQSENAAIVISTIDPLTSFNAVELAEQAAPFHGLKDGTYFDGTALRLDGATDVFSLSDFFVPGDFFLSTDGYRPLGYYDFSEVIDLEAIYTSRVSAQISAHGEWSSGDVFDVSDFFEREDFFGAIGGLWDVAVEVSTSDDDPGGAPHWSDWVPLVTGDVAARAYRFRARLESSQSDVTPVVAGLTVTVDMPDRVIAGDDIVVPSEGLSIPFSPAFKRLQGVSFAAQGLATGDTYEITGKTEAGFTIAFKNAAGTPVSRSLDYVAKGYGVLQ
ncbi:host specificity factor TipJ family phage tail protein [Mycoplana dimorpha]|uniref:Putative tail protein n=2 Tax=Mycoplana dimorpha TaxID=28320 RepID=A0A2T5B1K0_MYCDI|nr:host specificity factor TipJ family phage tail protein [Mycoplana dimorpha]PTM92861.1 putative tail protein [Mycoplana dimorpha]